jgi:outer membrane protein OmpA-like peptidoglycan-associated protein
MMRRSVLVGLAIAVGASLAACASLEGTSNRYVVFYQPWSAQLDNSAKGVVDIAAGFALRHPNLPVTVSGYADPVGSRQANMDISRTRARVVSDELVAMGVAPSRIQRVANGGTDLDDSLQASRRVEIDVGNP